MKTPYLILLVILFLCVVILGILDTNRKSRIKELEIAIESQKEFNEEVLRSFEIDRMYIDKLSKQDSETLDIIKLHLKYNHR